MTKKKRVADSRGDTHVFGNPFLLRTLEGRALPPPEITWGSAFIGPELINLLGVTIRSVALAPAYSRMGTVPCVPIFSLP